MKKTWKAIDVSQIWYEGNIDLDLWLAGLTSGLLWVRPAPGRTSSCLPPSWNGRPWRTFSLGVFLYSGDHQHQQHNNNHDNPDPEEAVLPWQLALISLGSQIGSVSIAKLKLDRVSLLYGQINLSETHLQIGRGPFGNVTFQSKGLAPFTYTVKLWESCASWPS